MNKWKKIKIFVFGSNLAGRHGAGAARFAMENHNAIYGQSFGLQGTSFAIPTKDRRIQTLSLTQIKRYINNFMTYAEAHSEYEFLVTRIGCGLAGLKDSDIAPMFRSAPSNCLFSEAWKEWLPKKKFDESLF